MAGKNFSCPRQSKSLNFLCLSQDRKPKGRSLFQLRSASSKTKNSPDSWIPANALRNKGQSTAGKWQEKVFPVLPPSKSLDCRHLSQDRKPKRGLAPLRFPSSWPPHTVLSLMSFWATAVGQYAISLGEIFRRWEWLEITFPGVVEVFDYISLKLIF